MQKLTRNDLHNLEDYAASRSRIRQQVMARKKNRQVPIGPHVTLYFEDRLTIQYQVQEMLRIERIFEAEAIQEELDAYNPLIPDGSNWKAVMMIEYDDVEQRRQALAQMIAIEDQTWVRIAGFDKVYAIADEDLDRDNDNKTSAVHFLRFELSNEMIVALKNNANLTMGIDHPFYRRAVDGLPPNVSQALVGDLD